MEKVYRSSKVSKIINSSLLLFFVGLLAFITKIFFTIDEGFSIVIIAVLVLLSLITSFIGYQVYCVFNGFVKITLHEIVMKRGVKSYSLLISDIKGFRNIVTPQISLLSLHSSSDDDYKIEIVLDYEYSQEILDWAKEHFKDLREEEFQTEMDAFLHDKKYGETEEARKRLFDLSYKWWRFMLLVGWLSTLGTFIPLLSKYAVIILSFLPVIILFSVPFFKGILSIEKPRNKLFQYILFPMSFPAFTFGIVAIYITNPISSETILIPWLTISSTILILSLFVCKKYTLSFSSKFSILVLSVILGLSWTLFYNQLWDSSSGEIYEVKVLEKHDGNSGIQRRKLVLEPWGYKPDGHKVKVSKLLYESISVGSYISVNVKQGFFSIPWYSVSKAPEHSVQRNKKWSEMDFLPEIGDTITSKSATPSIIMSSSSQFYTEEKLQFKGYRFSLGLNDSNEVCYISTNDSTFKTEEGIHIGSTFLSVQEKTNNSLVKEPGWGYYILLPSGWYAGFIKGSSHTEGIIDDGDKVRWLFKR